MATLKDIADAVGVSVSTVSNVLHERPNVGMEIRRKVMRAAKSLGYHPNRAAQAMRTGRTRAIGLVLPDLTNPFFPELAQAVENTARSAGLLVCLIDSQGRADGEADGLALLMQHGVDGIIWCPLGATLPATVDTFRQPIVLIDRPHPGYDVVHSDYVMGGRLLAEHAVNMGHTRVGLLSGPQSLESARQRRDGFVQAASRALKIAWEVNVGFDGHLSDAAAQALVNRRSATLIIAGNDLIAISAMRLLAEHGLRVPDDVSVAGFDNIRWSDLTTPALTTIAQPLGPIGAKAVEIVRERMSGLPLVSRRTIFDVSLIERGSVKQLERLNASSDRANARSRPRSRQ